MERLALASPSINKGAKFSPLESGGARIVTPPAPWSNAVRFPVSIDGSGAVLALVKVRRGEVEAKLLARDGSQVSDGSFVGDSETRLVVAQLDEAKAPARWLMIRNGARESPSECEVLAAFAGTVPIVRLADEDAALALRDPAAAKDVCARRVWPREVVSLLETHELPLRVEPPHAPLRVPPPQELWNGATEAIVLGTAEDLIELLDEFRPESLESHVALPSEAAMRSYLRMTVVRVVRLVELLRRRGIEQGKVLEVGAWLGSFSLALSRLGFDVVACDRYSSYGNAFDSYVALMRKSGVKVVSTSREHELDQISDLGQFDVVLAAAVIEHIPHTPRLFLETLFRAVRPGGIIALDTPNVARYWNRRALTHGQTIFQPLADQYDCEPPWEGHHREYTGSEMRWMLEKLGCEDVEVEFVDYNMLQFDELWPEHTECLAKIVEDPTQSDTLLAAGRRRTQP
jgi:SAM-dependent methyltransferase